MSVPLLSVDGLSVAYQVSAGKLPAVSDVSFELQEREVLGIVGESGSGKSTLGSALMRLLPSNGDIAAGRIELRGRDVVAMSDEELRTMRGQEVAMIFQDPLTSLNPTFKVGTQLVAAQRAHRATSDASGSDLRRRAIEMLTQVGIPDAEERIDYHPHQFSGGMRQRVMIAMALLLKPDLLIADEVTSALDVTLQAQILELLRGLQRERGTSMIFISHDLGVISEICDRVVVMYAGHAVEKGGIKAVLAEPKHPYTEALLASVPTKERRDQRLTTIPGRVPPLDQLPAGCPFAGRCPHTQDVCYDPGPRPVHLEDREVLCLIHDPDSSYDTSQVAMKGGTPQTPTEVQERERTAPSRSDVLVRLRGVETHFHDRPSLITRLTRRPVEAVKAVDGVDLEIRRGEIVGLVGESGSGKTTLGKNILGLVGATAGEITFDGQPIVGRSQAELQGLRRRFQIIFQASHASLSPRRRVDQLLIEPYRIHDVDPQDRIPVPELLAMVELSAEQASKYPHELSGGQARRVGIARALTLRPEFIVADEPTAGLDVSAAASVLNLMKDLATELGLTYLVITHDLNTVGYIADRVALMYLGKLVELGPTSAIFDSPTHPYSQGLLEAVPVPDPHQSTVEHRLLVPGEIPSPKNPPPGCRFHTRCIYARDESFADVPQLESVDGDHFVACHHWRENLANPERAAREAEPVPEVAAAVAEAEQAKAGAASEAGEPDAPSRGGQG